MKPEIERKFLVLNATFKQQAFKKLHIQQGFLNSHKERVVRVRMMGEKAFLTIKGVADRSGTSRLEWEKEIDVSDARALLNICEGAIIEKYRYYIKNEEVLFEVDEFLGNNKGLYIAEIELTHKNQPFQKPEWLGKEVTGIEKYYNASLSKQPFKNWV